jgi:hypothetical protein
VQDKAVEWLGPRPPDDPLEKEHSHALSAPIRFGEDIDDNGVPPFRDFVSFFRVRKNVAELNARSTGNDVWMLRGDREPSDIFASSQEIAEAFTRFCAKDFEAIWRDLAHFLEHARAMLSEGVHILGSGKTYRESLGHFGRIELRWRAANAQLTRPPGFSHLKFGEIRESISRWALIR